MFLPSLNKVTWLDLWSGLSNFFNDILKEEKCGFISQGSSFCWFSDTLLYRDFVLLLLCYIIRSYVTVVFRVHGLYTYLRRSEN